MNSKYYMAVGSEAFGTALANPLFPLCFNSNDVVSLTHSFSLEQCYRERDQSTALFSLWM